MNTMAALLASVAAVFGLNSPATTTPAINQHCVTINRYLSVGSTGTDVKQLQQFLGIKATGFFGLQTKGALVKWQVSTKVLATEKSDGAGGVGPKTRFALRCVSITNATSTPKIVSPIVPAIVPSTTSTPTPTNTISSPSTGGGGGSVASCKPFATPKPAASQCAGGGWTLISDEANCPVEWDCQSNSSDPE